MVHELPYRQMVKKTMVICRKRGAPRGWAGAALLISILSPLPISLLISFLLNHAFTSTARLAAEDAI
jgi:hypothetical protein